jgi:hypothetical protein
MGIEPNTQETRFDCRPINRQSISQLFPNQAVLGSQTAASKSYDFGQVVGLASGLGELPLQELIERADVVCPPVLSRTNLAEIFHRKLFPPQTDY